MAVGALVALLDHLGIDRVHAAARMAEDVSLLSAAPSPDFDALRIGSLTMVAPTSVPADKLSTLGTRAAMVASDRPQFGDLAMAAASGLPDLSVTTLADYQSFLWADLTVDHGRTIIEALVAQRDRNPVPDWVGAVEESGVAADVTYRISGHGQPLLLLPLGLAPSAWGPVVAELGRHFRVIVAGGDRLGMIPTLEMRGRSDGYRAMMARLFEWIDLKPGETVAEIGCGTGVVMRWLAEQTEGRNQIIGYDLNRYLLGEAAALVGRAGLGGLGDQLEFNHGNAEALPCEDNSFDVTFSTTVMEEVNADKMMAELVRVTKPGGRIGVVVRATDMAMSLNLPLPADELKRTGELEDRPEGEGCASAGLYDRMTAAGLEDRRHGPYLANFTDANGPLELYATSVLIARLGPGSAARWNRAVTEAAAAGTFVLAWPHHLAVGTKPASI